MWSWCRNVLGAIQSASSYSSGPQKAANKKRKRELSSVLPRLTTNDLPDITALEQQIEKLDTLLSDLNLRIAEQKGKISIDGIRYRGSQISTCQPKNPSIRYT